MPARFVRASVVIAVIGLCGAVLAACASSPRSPAPDAQRQTVWASDNGYVWLVPSETGAEPNAHPASLETSEIKGLLAALRAANAEGRGLEAATGGDHDGPVFTEDMRERLAEPLRQALADAGPDQDVILSVRGFRALPGSSRIGNTVVTSARVFYKDDALHVMVGELNRRIEREFPFQYTGPTDLSRRGGDARFGSRQPDGERRGWNLVGMEPGVTLAEHDGVARSDYVLAALDVDRDPAEPETEPRLPAADTAPEPPREEAVGVSQPSDPTAAADSDELPVADQPEVDTLPDSRREELRELRDLYDEGLIPESIYHERVRELLDR
ncbi:hypothetical protein M0534_06690 [Methylonatrum kenyense]|uniref:hypothetical protein n=1 Tax=Methylonatrum kenyense TaxID=455253 RepID=UPI0020BFBA35|nr:hypothetical protein [Methylonatrum kenyense]MCK8516011.1 hypothetical protein [Methylonatrum kenyense]